MPDRRQRLLAVPLIDTSSALILNCPSRSISLAAESLQLAVTATLLNDVFAEMLNLQDGYACRFAITTSHAAAIFTQPRFHSVSQNKPSPIDDQYRPARFRPRPPSA